MASQTFSKSYYSMPFGVAPLFLDKGKGAEVWDIDGNQYIDFMNALLAVSVGYQDEEIDNAVIAQLKSGVSFSLPHRLEHEVAEQIISLIPCAEMVRFGKNGTDATSAAVRLSRAYTGKDHLAVCGYHGWQDWYIGSTSRNLGVPDATTELTHPFSYNDIASLEAIFERHHNKIAAVILEPVNFFPPKNNFLEEVRALCDKHQAVLVFDETITGFRFNIGGAQTQFGVTPDLATFGKGMGNGYPISAITGKKEIMALMEQIFYSGTFAGETLSLAATKATINKLQTHNIPEHLHHIGSLLLDNVQKIIADTNMTNTFSLCGYPCWSLLQVTANETFSANQIKSLFIQEMLSQGILMAGTHNLSYAHKEKHIKVLANAYHHSLSVIQQAQQEDNFEKYFKGELIKDVFKVR